MVAGSGGVIYVDSYMSINGGGVGMDAQEGQGLWICGGGDHSCRPGSNGWRSQKQGTVKIIGISSNSSPAIAPGTGLANLYGCSSSTTTRPVLWLSGLSQPIYVENIDFGHGQCAQPVKIGISTDGNRKTSGAVSIYFRNVSASPNRKSPLHGPAIDIGSNVIWLWFERISCDANIAAAADSDARACILSNPSGAPASGPIYIRDSNFSGAGGIKFYQGSGGMNNFVENVMIESDGNTLCPPVVWVLNLNEAAHVQARNVAQADCPARTTYPAFQNDGSAAAVNMLVEGASGTE